MSDFRLAVLGGFEARRPDGRAVPLRARKAKALLAYLALRPGYADSRERVAGLLWGGQAEEKARVSLRQTIRLARRSFDGAGERVLVSRDDTLALDADALEVDVWRFEALAADSSPASLEAAAALYRGTLLEGIALGEPEFEEWAAIERARFRETAQDVLARLLDHYSATGALARGIRTGARLLALDSLQESVHRTLMRMYLIQSRPGAAIRQYETCRDALARELGIAPDAETERLHRHIRNEHGDPGPGDEVVGAAGGGVSDARADDERRRVVLSAAPRPSRTADRSATHTGASIAVLPFVAAGDDGPARYLGEGLADEIITVLARFREIAVIGRESSFSYGVDRVPPRVAGRELGVRYVLAGSALRNGAHVRVTARLLDVEDGRHVWAEQFDAHGADVLDLQSEVTQRVVGTLIGRLQRERSTESKRRAPESLEAYDYWLRGMDALREVRRRPALEAARRQFEYAIEVDPLFARAWAGLAMTSFGEWSCFSWSSWAWLDKNALDHARKAVELDSCDGHTQCILGILHLFRRGFGLSRKHLERAMSLNPNDANTLANLALGLPLLGEAEEGIRAGERAMALNPYHPDWYPASLGIAYFVARRYEDAIALLEPVPDAYCDGRAYLAASWAYLDDCVRASAYADQVRRLYVPKPKANPTLVGATCRDWLMRISPYRRADDEAHYAEGLDRAGIR